MNRSAKKPHFLKRAVIIFIIAACIITIIYLTSQTNVLNKEREELEKKLSEVELELEEAENRYNSEIDDEYIEKVAREKGYYKPEEKIYYTTLPES